MRIVGVGCGPGMLTEAAIAILRETELVYGSDRAIALARAFLPAGCEVHVIEDYRALRSLPEQAVVLSTGDPMLAGLGYLDGVVTCGISSLQVAAARLHIPLTRIAVISAHGKDHANAVMDAVAEIGRGKVAFILADPEFRLQDLADATEQAGLCPAIAICEDLGYPEERIVVGDTRDLPEVRSPRLYAVLAGTFPFRSG